MTSKDSVDPAHRPPGPQPLTRRTVLGTAAAAAAAPALLAGCATGGGNQQQQQQGQKDSKNPLGVKDDAALEVVIFEGGLGQDYAKSHEAMYKENFPKATINHSATTEIGKTLQPRFIDGTPPDVINNSGAGSIDGGTLVTQGQLQDLTELFDAPSQATPCRTVRQPLLPGAIESGSFDGKPFILNYAFTVYGLWYSTKLFKDKGWQWGKTWDEHIALCKTIKAAGLAAWTYPGAHPRYMSWPIISMAIKHGGNDVALNIDNLEPNAWKHESMKLAAEAWHQVIKDGYILNGSAGLDHKQSQTEWSKGNCAFVSCGSWLENEQKAVTPAGFDMTVVPTPSLGKSDKLPYDAIRGQAGEPFIVPAKAKNARGGMEYFRTMLSVKGAKDFTSKVSSLTIVAGSAEGVNLPFGLATCVDALKKSGDKGISWFYNTYYRKLERNLVDAACGEFFAGRIGPADFLERCQKGADEIAKDSTIKKYRRTK